MGMILHIIDALPRISDYEPHTYSSDCYELKENEIIRYTFGISNSIQTTSAAYELNRNGYAIIAKQRAYID